MDSKNYEQQQPYGQAPPQAYAQPPQQQQYAPQQQYAAQGAAQYPASYAVDPNSPPMYTQPGQFPPGAVPVQMGAPGVIMMQVPAGEMCPNGGVHNYQDEFTCAVFITKGVKGGTVSHSTKNFSLVWQHRAA
ncbi:hypothetical protein HDU67_003834 [Dinochytrium kinnereticum]|nr:hypothetical protein HDU67_003834 [Dinochytrium kinnereticum]